MDRKLLESKKIQIFRALAIIAVISIHTAPMGVKQVIIRPFINYAVAMFLFLSGYLTQIDIKENYISIKKNRIWRVLIPYIIWSIIYTIYQYMESGYLVRNSNEVKIFVITLLTNMITTKSNGYFYYIFVYIQMVLLTPILFKLLKSKYWWMGFLVSPIASIVYMYSAFWGLKHNMYLSLIWDVSCFAWIIYYYLGLFLTNFEIKIQKKIKINHLTIMLMICIILQMVEGYIWLKYVQVNYGSQLKLTTYMCNIIFLIICYRILRDNNILIKNKYLIEIGNCSFGIYLIHGLLISVGNKSLICMSMPFIIKDLLILGISYLIVYSGRKIFSVKICKIIGFI